MGQIKFFGGSYANYQSLESKDSDALYFLDNNQLYKGENLISDQVRLITAAENYPVTPERGVIYVKTNGEAKYYNGTTFTTLTKEITSSISASSTNNQIPTAKTVYDLVSSLSPDGYADLVAKVGKHDTDIAGLKTGKADKASTLAGYGITNANTKEEITTLLKTKADQETTYTKTEVDTKVNTKANASDVYKKSEVDTKVNAKANSTDVYKKTETYSKSESDSKIAAAVAGAGHITKEIVEILPAIKDAKENVIYMILKRDGSGDNLYDEHMLLNGKLEKIGDTKVDLTNYATKTYADGKANSALTSAKSYTDTQVASTLTTAQGYADGKLAESKTYTDSAKASAISTAAADAKTKADAAKSGAISAAATDATTKADKAKSDAVAAAANDATTKANKAKTDAVAAAKTYTDSQLVWQTIK